MANLSEVVNAIAHSEGLEPASVALIARYVREAGLISKRGRGLAAAQMNVSDAANLLIAVNTSRHAAVAAADAVLAYRPLTAYELLEKPKPGGRPRVLGNLGEAVELLISAVQVRVLSGSFLGKPVPPNLEEAFRRGGVHIELKFRTSTPGASLRISAHQDIGVVAERVMMQEIDDLVMHLMAEEVASASPDSTLSFKFIAPRGPRKRGPDRKEETTIGYPTLGTVANLIQ